MGRRRSSRQLDLKWQRSRALVEKSARQFDPVPPPVLYHLQGGLSFTKLSGNLDATMYKGDATVLLRKKMFTSATQISSDYRKTDINITDKHTTVDKHSIHEGLSYALTNRLDLGCGIMWERDNAILLVNRLTYYAGGKGSVLTKPPVLMKVGAYLGYEDETYDDGEMKSSFTIPRVPGVFDGYDPFDPNDPGRLIKGYSSPGIRLMEDATILLSPKHVLLQSFDLMLRTKETSYYHWKGSLTFQSKVTSFLTFTAKYQYEYQNALIIERLENAFENLNGFMQLVGKDKHFGLSNTDEILYLGVQFNM
ncbi:MAG: DUF481 domain-containing protein [SAR324 cluster bacterium]|nr:DUF481 domain-containing protein [SAR324 cluster bacterium]